MTKFELWTIKFAKKSNFVVKTAVCRVYFELGLKGKQMINISDIECKKESKKKRANIMPCAQKDPICTEVWSSKHTNKPDDGDIVNVFQSKECKGKSSKIFEYFKKMQNSCQIYIFFSKKF